MEFLLLCMFSSLLIKNLGSAKNTPKVMENINNKLMQFDKTMKYINQNEDFCKKPSLTTEKRLYCDLYEIQKNFQTPEEQLKRVSLFLLKNKHPIHNIYKVQHFIDTEVYELDDNGEMENEYDVGRYEYDPREA
jgi:hypothetical protein